MAQRLRRRCSGRPRRPQRMPQRLHCDESTSEGPTRSVEEDHSDGPNTSVEEASVEDAIGEEASDGPLKAPLIRHVES